MPFWKWATEEEAGRFKAHELLREQRQREREAAVPTPLPTPTPRPVPTPTPREPRLPAFAPRPAPRQLGAQPGTYGQALKQAVGQIPSLLEWGRQLVTPGQWPQGVPSFAEPITQAYEDFRQQIARPVSMLTQERVAAPLLGELMRWNVPYRALAPERAGPSPWADIPELGKRAVGIGEPLPGVGRLPAFAKQRYEEARAYEATLPGAVRLAGRQILDPLGLGGAWAASMLTGPLAAIYKVVDITDYTLFLISANKEERAMAAALIGAGITARNLPKIRAFVKRVAEGAGPAVRRAAQEAAPSVRRFIAEEVGAAEIPGKVPEPVPKQPWQMTRQEYEGRRLFSPSWDPDHAEVIQEALAEGKPVPAEVLTEYPELAARAPAPEAPPARLMLPGRRPIEAPVTELPPGRYPMLTEPPMNEAVLRRLKDAREWDTPLGRVRDLLEGSGLQQRFADILDVEVGAAPRFSGTGLRGDVTWYTSPVEPEPFIKIWLAPEASRGTILHELTHAQQRMRQGYTGRTRPEQLAQWEEEARPVGEPWKTLERARYLAEVPTLPVRAPEVAPPPTELLRTEVARPRPAVAPSAEPAVAPAAAPAVPVRPAEAPAEGIPGPPSVGAEAGRPVQPPLAGVPPVEPPPLGPGIAMAPAPGPGRFAEMLPSSEILRLAQRPNNVRKLMDWAEQHPRSPLKWVLQRIGISGTDPTSEATVLVNTIRADSDAAVMTAVAKLRAFGDSDALFDVQDNVAHIRGQAVAIGDLSEGRVPESVKAALNSEQRAYLAEGWAYFDDLERLAAAEGVDIPKATYGPGEHYWARNVMGRMMPDGTLEVATVRGAPSGRWLTALAGFERPRMFDTMEEALTNDFRYFDLSDAAEMSGRAIYRRIANKRLLDYIVENIPSRVGKKARYAEVTLPGLKRYFQAEDIVGVKKLLEDSPLTWLEEFADVVNAVNRLPRLLTTVFDLGPGMAQLYNMLCNWPRQWAKAVGVSFRSAFEPVSFQRFLAQPEHAATVRRTAPYGLVVSGSELTEAARTTFGPTRFLGKIPLVGEAVRVGARVFDNMMTAARILGIEATEYQVKNADDMSELVAFWNKATGMVEPGVQGISRRQQKLEAVALFAPRLYRATYGLLFDVAHGGLRGKMARNSLAQMATVTLLSYVGLCGLLKQKPRLDPREGSRWLTFEIGDQYVGIRGSLFMTLRLLAQMGRSPEDAQELAGRYLRGRLSPFISTSIDVYNRADFIGMPIETPLQLTKRIVVDNLTPFWVQGVFESGVKDWKQMVAVSGAELAGLRTFPVSPARKRNAIREQLAQARFGKPWASLSRPETYELEQVPELREAVEQARALGVERRQPWALFWADVDSQREPYRIQIAELGQELQRGQRTGRSYREELAKRQMLMARIPEMLQRTREYEDIRLEGREPENAVDQFIDAYYKIADEARDPLTGVADARQIVMDREALKGRTPDDVARQAMSYINRRLDPEYVQARDLYYEYMRIPQYLGLSEDEAQLANEAMRTFRDMRRANPQMHLDWTRAILARENPEGFRLMLLAQARRNPERRGFWAEHPLLSKFYSDLTTEELEMVLPEQMQGMWQAQPQPQLPAFAGASVYGQ